MTMMKQYHSPEIYAVFHRIFMEESIGYQADLFREMIQQGYFISIDPEIIAVTFYSLFLFAYKIYGRT